MKVLTLGGQTGAGAPEIGSKIARTLGYKYVEHLALRRLVRRLDATAEAVTKKELAFGSRKSRFLQQLELMFARFGWYGADMAMGEVPSAEYIFEMLDSKKRMPAEISTDEYMDAIRQTAHDFADEGPLLLVKRAGVLTLRERPDTAHIGLFAPLDLHVSRISSRLRVGYNEAEEIVRGLEHASSAWFDAIGEADPADRALYDMTFELGSKADDNDVIRKIVSEVKSSATETLNDGYSELAAPIV